MPQAAISGAARLRRYLSRPDQLLTAAALVIMLSTSVPGDTWQLPAGWAAAVVVLSWLPLTMRAYWPLPVLAAVLAADTVHIALAGHAHPPAGTIPAATMLALYTVAARYPARVAWAAAAAAGVVQFTVALVSYPHAGLDLLYLNWAVVATVLGLLIRERRERIAAAEQRAEDAEHNRQAEADRQVTAERIRIAHELHDVLAHHIAVVNAQAGVAQYLLRTNPAAADTALAGIAANSRAALDELRATLGLLRAEGGAAPGDPRAPVPTIEHLGRLLDGFTDAGMRLSVGVHGQPGSLSGPADLAFYRIVQEALTNATKHAPGSDVCLDIDWSAASVHLTVSNTKPAGAPQELVNQGTGHGLIGMQERAAAAGGTVSAGPAPAGGYRVTATLPVMNAAEAGPGESAAETGKPHRSDKPVTS
ncbi:MAG: sensor histidine kinase [Streptosporangiaceae bacterium]